MCADDRKLSGFFKTKKREGTAYSREGLKINDFRLKRAGHRGKKESKTTNPLMRT